MSLLLLDGTPNVGLFPPEMGRLRIDGTTFRHEDGSLHQWRGYSWFLGFYRFCNGEDVTPDLRWLRQMGFNNVRLFGPLPWKEINYKVEDFRFDLLPRFFDLLASYGLRCNWSLAHYEHTANEAYVQRWFNFAQDYDLVSFAEGVNEPHVGKTKPDPGDLLYDISTYRVRTSYGYYKEAMDGNPGWPPVLDFGTIHIPRDSAWPRRARMSQECQQATEVPWISDEPAKLVEPGFDYPGGKNDPKHTPDEMVWHAAVCMLWTPGFTFHCEEGKWGRVPTPGMLQHTCAERVRDDVFKKMGAHIQVGDYNRGGNSDSPVKNVYTDENQIWVYTSLHEHEAWSVCCGDEKLVAQNGWTIVDSWANGTLARLER